jgi:hypothetical protein
MDAHGHIDIARALIEIDAHTEDGLALLKFEARAIEMVLEDALGDITT